MSRWLNLGQIIHVNARKFPNTTATCDAHRRYTYPQLNERSCRLANALTKLGLKKGDKVAVLLENCTEFIEVYCAAAKSGLIAVPVNFRLIPSDIQYILNDSGAKALIVHDEFVACAESIRGNVPAIPKSNYIGVGAGIPEGYIRYEELLAEGSAGEPHVEVNDGDTWIMLYTSGTTGRPKGVIRSHASYIAFYLINCVDFGYTERDVCMNIMPLCHVNSTYFSFCFTYLGGTVYVHPARKFDPLDILKIVEKEKVTFISLVPTHYNLILSVPAEVRAKVDVSSVKKLLCSSAPARRDMKLAIMDYFKGVELYEGYGSTEAGIVTVLKPHEQLGKLGSIGRESCGTDMIKILDGRGDPVPCGEIGELYSRGPMLFDGYYNMPEKTRDSFKGGWFSAGDMARQDEDGYYWLVDRKNNLIITGGEHVFPSEVEEIVCKHSKVFDCAIIGVPDAKWGEAVTAVVVLKPGRIATAEEISEFCKDKMAGFKRPKTIMFIKSEDMPRTATGKILHRVLRERFGGPVFEGATEQPGTLLSSLDVPR
jgi:acyl-CoA synthetase (AMP-forming)/AMP-acid ligase II